MLRINLLICDFGLLPVIVYRQIVICDFVVVVLGYD